MVDNDEPDHGRYANIEKISYRKMIILFEIFHDHRDEFKIQKEHQNAFQEFEFYPYFRIIKRHLYEIEDFLSK